MPVRYICACMLRKTYLYTKYFFCEIIFSLWHSFPFDMFFLLLASLVICVLQWWKISVNVSQSGSGLLLAFCMCMNHFVCAHIFESFIRTFAFTCTVCVHFPIIRTHFSSSFCSIFFCIFTDAFIFSFVRYESIRLVFLEAMLWIQCSSLWWAAFHYSLFRLK